MFASKATDAIAHIPAAKQAIESFESALNDAAPVLERVVNKLGDEDVKMIYTQIKDDAKSLEQSDDKIRSYVLAGEIGDGFLAIKNALETNNDDKIAIEAKAAVAIAPRESDDMESVQHVVKGILNSKDSDVAKAAVILDRLDGGVTGIKLGYFNTFDEPIAPHEITGKDGTVYHVTPAE